MGKRMHFFGGRPVGDDYGGGKRKGGFDGERTRTEARYQKTRDAREALGYCSKVGTALRYALADVLPLIGDRYAPARINGLFMAIRGCDPEAAVPKRLATGLSSAAGKALLLAYNFQKTRKLGANILRPSAVDIAAGRMTLQQFVPSLDLKFPKGTKMAALQFMLVRVDLETFAYSVSSSTAATFAPTDGERSDLVLEAALPEGNGVLFALLLSGFCDHYDGNLRWSLRKETALGFVGFAE